MSDLVIDGKLYVNCRYNELLQDAEVFVAHKAECNGDGPFNPVIFNDWDQIKDTNLSDSHWLDKEVCLLFLSGFMYTKGMKITNYIKQKYLEGVKNA